jgi:tetraacyldisaccharide-1-P 4'-kinase
MLSVPLRSSPVAVISSNHPDLAAILSKDDELDRIVLDDVFECYVVSRGVSCTARKGGEADRHVG